MKPRTYIAIDLKSFFASVECRARGLDPLRTMLVVADKTRTSKTICLAVTPPLKAFGTGGRPRLFEVEQRVAQANRERARRAPGGRLGDVVTDSEALEADPSAALGYLIAPPRMARYIETSTKIYGIYLEFVAPEDIHPYSIDEVFIDATDYLALYGTDAKGFATTLIKAVLKETGITATAGIGSNLYLAKIAMDIGAKHIEPDEHGARIAELTVESYRRNLWDYTPISDFWRVGRGIAARLEAVGIRTMGDVARCSLGHPGARWSEETLFRLLGVNAELLIDHAWGVEPCTIAAIKAYRPRGHSLGSGQVLQRPYEYGEALIVAKEMTDALALDLVSKGLAADQLVLQVGYDAENLKDAERRCRFRGEIVSDGYGRPVPRPARGSRRFDRPLSSSVLLMEAVEEVFRRSVDPSLLIRRISIALCNTRPAGDEPAAFRGTPDLFDDGGAEAAAEAKLEREKRLQMTTLLLKAKFGRNAVLRGISGQKGATARERNNQIGGHKA